MPCNAVWPPEAALAQHGRGELPSSINKLASFLNNEALRILPRMLSAVLGPSAMAPVSSMTVAIMQACFSVKLREPTEVAKELATSLAPVP